MDQFTWVEIDKNEDRKSKIETLKNAIVKNQIYRKELLKRMETIAHIEKKNTSFLPSSEKNLQKEEKRPMVDVFPYVQTILSSCHFEEDEDRYDYLKEVLPSRNDTLQYEQIINMILIQLLIEKNEWVDAKIHLKKEEEKEVSFYDEIILDIQKVIDMIFLIRDEKLEEIPKEGEKNTLLFLTKGNRVCFEEDIEQMQESEYSLGLFKLFQSIRDNTFWYRNYRRFNSNIRKMSSIIEVKGFRIRILISRIDTYTYVVLGAFIKKTTWGNGIQQAIIRNIDYYETKKEEIIHLYQNDDGCYGKENEKILSQIEDTMKTYVKRGNIK